MRVARAIVNFGARVSGTRKLGKFRDYGFGDSKTCVPISQLAIRNVRPSVWRGKSLLRGWEWRHRASICPLRRTCAKDGASP